MTIQRAAHELAELGYRLGNGSTDLQAGVTSYEVTDAAGETRLMSTSEIIALLKTRQV